jgi:GMP reductase
VCIDVANGYHESFVRFVARIRERYPQLVIMAGNVVTGRDDRGTDPLGRRHREGRHRPGSVCTTRKMTGVGYPQLSAIIECADAAHGLEGHICADGGCATPGDIAKAFGGGADFVMLGGMLAGHAECGGETRRARRPSLPALLRHEQQGGDGEVRGRRRADTAPPRARKCSCPAAAPWRTVQEILGGVRSACTYVGARTLKRAFTKRTTFVRVTQQLNEVFGKG